MVKTGFRISCSGGSGLARRFVSKSLLTLFIAGPASLSSLSAKAAPLPLVQEPLFGLVYDSNEVKFDPVPPDLLLRCGLDPSVETDRRSVYAQVDSSGSRYMIIGGLVRASPGERWQDDSTGEFLRANATACDLVDPGNDVFPPADYDGDPASDDPQYPIGMDVYRSLAMDAVNRYSLAFGSLQEFVKTLHEQKAYPDHAPPSVLDAILQKMTE